MVEKAGSDEMSHDIVTETTLTREEYQAVQVLLSATDARQAQWQAAAEGDLLNVVDELHESDDEECINMVKMYGASAHIVRNLMKRFENNTGGFA